MEKTINVRQLILSMDFGTINDLIEQGQISINDVVSATRGIPIIYFLEVAKYVENISLSELESVVVERFDDDMDAPTFNMFTLFANHLLKKDQSINKLLDTIISTNNLSLIYRFVKGLGYSTFEIIDRIADIFIGTNNPAYMVLYMREVACRERDCKGVVDRLVESVIKTGDMKFVYYFQMKMLDHIPDIDKVWSAISLFSGTESYKNFTFDLGACDAELEALEEQLLSTNVIIEGKSDNKQATVGEEDPSDKILTIGTLY